MADPTYRPNSHFEEFPISTPPSSAAYGFPARNTASAASRPRRAYPGEKESDQSGIWSMIFGICGLVCLGTNCIFPIVSLILAVISGKTHGKKPTSCAKAGKIMGIIGLIANILLTAVLLLILLLLYPKFTA